MRLITKNTDYAIRALLSLAKNKDKLISSSLIARQERIPLAFLRGILQRLIKRGIIVSKEGVSGGVRLAKKPSHIRVSDLIRMFQGDIELTQCLFRKRICSNRPECILRKNIKVIEVKLIREFDKISIASLLKQERR